MKGCKMYDKNQIDRDAEREAECLQRQGRTERPERIRQETSDYNRTAFEKLFK